MKIEDDECNLGNNDDRRKNNLIFSSFFYIIYIEKVKGEGSRMTNIIYRDMVNQALTEYIEGLNECTDNINPVSLLMGVQGIIRTMPNAEKTGKWVDIVEMDSGGYPFKVGVCCSACGFETVNEDNYCPNCGVKMKGDIK